MSHLSRNIVAVQRDFAQTGQTCAQPLDDLCELCQGESAAGDTIRHAVVDSPDYYPSPDRYVPSRRVSVSPFCLWAETSARASVFVAFCTQITDAGAIGYYIKGLDPCLNHRHLSRLPHFSGFRPAFKTMQSVHWLVQALAVWLATRLVTTIALKAHLRAGLSAHLQTTSKAALQNTTKIIETAAAGQPCARRFCF